MRTVSMRLAVVVASFYRDSNSRAGIGANLLLSYA